MLLWENSARKQIKKRAAKILISGYRGFPPSSIAGLGLGNELAAKSEQEYDWEHLGRSTGKICTSSFRVAITLQTMLRSKRATSHFYHSVVVAKSSLKER